MSAMLNGPIDVPKTPIRTSAQDTCARSHFKQPAACTEDTLYFVLCAHRIMAPSYTVIACITLTLAASKWALNKTRKHDGTEDTTEQAAVTAGKEDISAAHNQNYLVSPISNTNTVSAGRADTMSDLSIEAMI